MQQKRNRHDNHTLTQ